eukprot:TRINITY_DN21_c0_g2_i1.p1 TRINITY_DN21_c0_g2~~TRINITY_DN21_c0_g2_i1.p1  ORF type:complete len:707 (-),score=141.12 TRINITY_DN21_c0_g2_i1:7988-10108(-)
MDEEFPCGAVVWAKVPSYPWWPAKVIEPEPSHLTQLRVNKIRSSQYVVVFYNDNEQIALCADYNLKPFGNRSIHNKSQKEKGQLRSRLLKAIEYAEDDLKILRERKQGKDPPTRSKGLHDEHPQSTQGARRSYGSKSEKEVKEKKKKRQTDSPVVVRKSSTTLGKRKSSSRNKAKPNPMEDFIVEEDDEVDVELSEVVSEDEVALDSEDGANHRHKKARFEEQVREEISPEKHHRSKKKSSKPRNSEKKSRKPRAEGVTPSQRVDVQDTDVHPIKNRSKKQNIQKEAPESVIAPPPSRPPSLSEEAYKSMIRDTENVEELSKRARFKVLMEHLRAIRESNRKQWKEGLKSADESTIIREEVLLLKAVVPALLSGRRLVRWVSKGNRKTSETAGVFNKMEKEAIERALAVQNVYFELAPEQLNVAGSKLRDVMKNLAGISRAASRCFRDILILWNDIYVPGPLKDCTLNGVELEESDICVEDALSSAKVKEERTSDSKPGQHKVKPHDSAELRAASDSLKSGSRRTSEGQQLARPEEEYGDPRRETSEWKGETSNEGEEPKPAKNRISEDSHRNYSASSAKEKEPEDLQSTEAGKRRNRWKGFSKDKFMQVIRAQLSPLSSISDESEQMEFIEALEKQLSNLFDPCTNGYYKTGLLMTHGIQRLVKSYKQSDPDDDKSDIEGGGLKLLLDALEHPEQASNLVKFILK